MKIENKNLEALLKVAESMNWSYRIYKDDYPDRSRCYVEMETSSPLGEDFLMVIDFKEADPIHSFLDDLDDYYTAFVPEEHAALYIDNRGKNGIPGSIRALLDDADDIDGMIEELCIALHDAAASLGKEDT